MKRKILFLSFYSCEVNLQLLTDCKMDAVPKAGNRWKTGLGKVTTLFLLFSCPNVDIKPNYVSLKLNTIYLSEHSNTQGRKWELTPLK